VSTAHDREKLEELGARIADDGTVVIITETGFPNYYTAIVIHFYVVGYDNPTASAQSLALRSTHIEALSSDSTPIAKP
jgi:hypothetical protein